MLIGIDAHNLEGKRTGVGRYLFNLLREWGKLANSEWPASLSNRGELIANSRFILYFKDEIPQDLPESELFECKLLNVGSTAKFMHWDLARVAAADKIDILFCPAYVAPLGYRGKMALTLHDISYEARPEEFNWPSLADRFLLKWASRRAAEKTSVIFTPSEFSRQEVIKHYGVPAEKVVVTLLAVEASLSSGVDDNEAAAINAKYGLKDEFAFYIGSIFTRRHLSEVIAAFECLIKEGDYQLLLGGKDYTEGRSINKLVKKMNKKLGREAILRVDFIAADELKSLYGACAFFIWLSDYEGFGLPPLEAMSLGAPVITTDGSSLSEVVGQAALLIKDNFDVEEIFRAMHKITRDRILREELILRGREQSAKFSWRECAERTLEVLMAIK
ncbi:MAG: glycosyltransferase family 1 protein [Candidatus Portnoybacteria bacterium]|nr:glycosyltransferase family 1 protein [Candidatus Portnoybacteria bacterium]MDD4983081.1 glycosyltransferase family 1 protein [Candidatus Portnoybacteria bacterium]